MVQPTVFESDVEHVNDGPYDKCCDIHDGIVQSKRKASIGCVCVSFDAHSEHGNAHRGADWHEKEQHDVNGRDGCSRSQQQRRCQRYRETKHERVSNTKVIVQPRYTETPERDRRSPYTINRTRSNIRSPKLIVKINDQNLRYWEVTITLAELEKEVDVQLSGAWAEGLKAIFKMQVESNKSVSCWNRQW